MYYSMSGNHICEAGSSDTVRFLKSVCKIYFTASKAGLNEQQLRRTECGSLSVFSLSSIGKNITA